jgi:hypothetical protein
MPGPSFDLPAITSCPSCYGSVCKICYATRGNYKWPNVIEAQNARFEWTKELVKKDLIEWASIVTYAIKLTGTQYFRIHSSGDFFNSSYTKAWYLICNHLKTVRFWAPTRIWSIVNSSPFPMVNSDSATLHWLQRMNQLPNVTIRPSGIELGDKPPVVKNLAAGSTVDGPSDYTCPSKQQNNKCMLCRHCWDNKNLSVTYEKS